MSNHAPSRAETLTVRAPAKVNLALEVLGERPDGYHEIRTVMQTVSFWDELTVAPRGDGRILLRCSDPSVPTDERNLVVRAARRLKEHSGAREGAEISLTKRIPVGGGLGGGSSDCAAALRALRCLWKLDVTEEELHQMGSELGSDVSFFLHGGTALCEGRGEKVTPIECNATLHYALAMPGFSVSTAAVYERAAVSLTSRSVKRIVSSLEECGASPLDVAGLGSAFHNDLQEAAFAVDGRLRRLMARLEAVTDRRDVPRILLCGSGSTILLLHRDARGAGQTSEVLQRELSLSCRSVRSLRSGERS